MALSVDLFGIAMDGSIVWRWMVRHWNATDVLELVRPPASDPPPAWEGPITAQQIEALRDKSGGRAKEAAGRADQVAFGVQPAADLDELLVVPVQDVIVRVEEWGFG